MKVMKRKLLLLGALGIAGGCASSGSPTPFPHLTAQRLVHGSSSETLLAYDNSAGDIEAWNVTASGGTTPWVFTTPGFTQAVTAMAGAGSFGSGEEVVLAGAEPTSQTTLFDLASDTVEAMSPSEPWGPPIDSASLIGGVADTLYADGSYETMPFDRNVGIHKTACTGILDSADSITADTLGDVFIQGTGPNGFAGVVELHQSSQKCSALNLKPQKGTAAGITIDPSTNDLIVGDNPRSCQGATDGRLIVYPPPYHAGTGDIYKLSGVGCAGLFRLDSGASGDTYLFMLDSDGSTTQIDQLEYPSLLFEGSYSGGDPSAPTTLPNALPNG